MSIYDASEHFTSLNIDTTIPRCASNSPGTEAENQAVVTGSIGTISTYPVDEPTRTISSHVVASTFPNSAGQEQKRANVTVTEDELIYVNPAPTSQGGAGSTRFVFKRVKQKPTAAWRVIGAGWNNRSRSITR